MTKTRWGTTHWAGALMFLLLIVPYANRFGIKLVRADPPVTEPVDLASFYWAADNVFNRHVSPYGPGAFAGSAHRAGKSVFPFLYPPPSLFVFYPLSRLTFDQANIAALGVSHLGLLASLGLLLAGGIGLPRDPERRVAALLFALAFAFTAGAVATTFVLGQVNLLLLLLLTLVWFGLKRNWPAWTVGLPLAVACVLKLYPVLLFPLLMIRRGYAAAGWAAGFVAAGTVASLFALPGDTWRDFVTQVAPAGGYGRALAGQFAPATPGAVSLNALTARLFLGYEQASPLYVSPPAAKWVPMALSALLVLLTWGLSLRTHRSAADPEAADLELSLYLLTMVLAAPLAWEHHLAYALPAFLVVIAQLVFTGRSAVTRVVAAAAVLVIAWPQMKAFGTDVWAVRFLADSNKTLALIACWVLVSTALYRRTSRAGAGRHDPAGAPVEPATEAVAAVPA